MNKGFFYVFMLFFTLNTHSLAQECSYSGGLFLVWNKQSVDEAKWTIFSDFFSAAQSNVRTDIVSTFSQIDGSDSIADEGISDYNKFVNYKDMELLGAEDEEILWGNYRVREYRYRFKSLSTSMPVSVLCDINDADCRVSLALESSENIDFGFLSNALSFIRKQSGGPTCSSFQELLSVYPQTGAEKFPIVIGLSLDLENIRPSESSFSPLIDCVDISNLRQCTPDNIESALIPIFDLNREKNVYFSWFALTEMLFNAVSIYGVGQLNIEGRELLIIEIKSSTGRSYGWIYPLLDQKLDQSFYGANSFNILSDKRVFKELLSYLMNSGVESINMLKEKENTNVSGGGV